MFQIFFKNCFFNLPRQKADPAYGRSHKRWGDTHLRVEQHLLEEEGAQEPSSPSEENPSLPEVVLVQKRSPERPQLNVQASNTKDKHSHNP